MEHRLSKRPITLHDCDYIYGGRLWRSQILSRIFVLENVQQPTISCRHIARKRSSRTKWHRWQYTGSVSITYTHIHAYILCYNIQYCLYIYWILYVHQLLSFSTIADFIFKHSILIWTFFFSLSPPSLFVYVSISYSIFAIVRKIDICPNVNCVLSIGVSEYNEYHIYINFMGTKLQLWNFACKYIVIHERIKQKQKIYANRIVSNTTLQYGRRNRT